MLTDLIQERHLKWLGVVEWKDSSCEPIRLTKAESPSSFCIASFATEVMYGDENRWEFFRWIDNHTASCILEHAFRVKLEVEELTIELAGDGLGTSGYAVQSIHEPCSPVVQYETYEEALIAAVDVRMKAEADET